MASKIKLRINGREQKNQSLWLTSRGHTAEFFAGVECATIELTGSARGTNGDLLCEIPIGALVEVELEGGLHFWTSAEDLRARLTDTDTGNARGLDDQGYWPLPIHIGLPGAQRGFVGQMVLKSLRWLNIKPDDALRNTIIDKAQYRAIPVEGVFPVLSDGTLGPRLTKPIPDGERALILLHGTASSTDGSFSGLWQHQKDKWAALRNYYGDRIYALEHWTLTRSPIENARDAARILPRRGTVSFLSHSRGGLVGELLCLDPSRFDLAATQSILGPRPGDDDSQRATAKKHQQALSELITELASRPDLRIGTFVRAACPSRGTSLTGDKLDQWGSLMILAAIAVEMKDSGKRSLGIGATDLISAGFDTLVETIASVLASRRRLDELPGLEAMMPGSSLLAVINGARARGQLYVIAGDAAPIEEDRLSAFRIWLVDRFYERDHDLVVDTRSMLDGAIRDRGGDACSCKVQFRSGGDVNHFRYFRNDDSTTAAIAALTESPHANQYFEDYCGDWPIVEASVDQARDGVFGTHAIPDSTEDVRGTVVIVPGLCGTQLLVNNNDIWANILSLAGGAFCDRLGLDIGNNVSVGQPISGVYVPLANTLRQRGYKVDLFGYDWRKPLAESIDNLEERIKTAITAMAPNRKPVHIVAHSMGGILLRYTFLKKPRLWEDWDSQPGDSHVLMLGTPNQGSHAITRLLTGRDSFFRKLALLDLKNSHEALLETVGRFGGVMELLPWSKNGNDRQIREKTIWEAFKEADLGAKWPLPSNEALKNSRTLWEELDNEDPLLTSPRLVYVAGHADQTPSKAEIDSNGCFQIFVTEEGDGWVPWSTGIPQSCRNSGRVYYVQTMHGDLPKAADAFDGYIDILEKGRSDKLSSLPSVREARRSGIPQQWRTNEADASLYPTRSELLAAAMGGALPSARKVERRTYRTEVRVLHGDLMYSESVVLVGHNWGATSLELAEKLLDQALGGRMQRMLDAGLHAGVLGTFTIYRKQPGDQFSQGAIVIGMGRIGQLSPSQLAQSVAKAIASYAIEEMDIQGAMVKAIDEETDIQGAKARTIDEASPKRLEPFSVPISALLIGSGVGELSLADSVTAIMRGHRDARLRLEHAGLGDKLRLDRLDFIEILEDRAINALRAAGTSVQVDVSLARAFFVDAAIRPHKGARRRASSANEEGFWQRIAISTVGNANDEAPRLMFDVYGELARAERIYNAVPIHATEHFTQSLIGNTTDQEQVSRALFELLLPNWLKDLAPDRQRVQLMLDPTAAFYPWELLRDRATAHDGDSGHPLSVRSGLIRQLSTGQFRLNVRRTTNLKALVIGDPDLGEWHRFLPSLLGAEQEAIAVFNQLDQLREIGLDPVKHIRSKASPILLDLFSDEWRLLHLSGHGVYLQDIPATAGLPALNKATGMVIGEGNLLTPAHIEQMRAVPDFVFLNCCYLGRIEQRDGIKNSAGRPGNPALAANLATKLIEAGVRCVIAAGWEVLDSAAKLFAETFYEHFLSGINFGDSVLAARKSTFNLYGSSNTWGAYQCYGDPGFVLNIPRSKTLSRVTEPNYDHYVSASEVLFELERLALRANHASVFDKGAADSADRHSKALLILCDRKGWNTRGDILEAFGTLKAEYNKHLEAIDYYKRAIAAPDGRASRKAEEQLSNMLTRWAKVLAKDGDTEEALALLKEADSILDVNNSLFPASAERLNLQGAIEKRLIDCLERVGKIDEFPNTLMAMYTAYCRAVAQAKIEGGDIRYPAFNAANACALMGLISGFPESEPQKMQMLLRDMRKTDPPKPKDFWGLASHADQLLAEGLLQVAIGNHGSTNQLKEAFNAYSELMKMPSSPRERESLTSTIDILLLVLQKSEAAKGQEQAKAIAESELTEIRKAIGS